MKISNALVCLATAILISAMSGLATAGVVPRTMDVKAVKMSAVPRVAVQPVARNQLRQLKARGSVMNEVKKYNMGSSIVVVGNDASSVQGVVTDIITDSKGMVIGVAGRSQGSLEKGSMYGQSAFFFIDLIGMGMGVGKDKDHTIVHIYAAGSRAAECLYDKNNNLAQGSEFCPSTPPAGGTGITSESTTWEDGMKDVFLFVGMTGQGLVGTDTSSGTPAPGDGDLGSGTGEAEISPGTETGGEGGTGTGGGNGGGSGGGSGGRTPEDTQSEIEYSIAMEDDPGDDDDDDDTDDDDAGFFTEDMDGGGGWAARGPVTKGTGLDFFMKGTVFVSIVTDVSGRSFVSFFPEGGEGGAGGPGVGPVAQENVSPFSSVSVSMCPTTPKGGGPGGDPLPVARGGVSAGSSAVSSFGVGDTGGGVCPSGGDPIPVNMK